MVIHYCQTCGRRIPDAEIASHAAVLRPPENEAYCAPCVSAGRVPRALSRHAGQGLPQGSATGASPPPHAQPATRTTTVRPSRPAPVSAEPSRSHKLYVICAVAGASVLLAAGLLVLLLAGRAPKTPLEEKSASVEPKPAPRPAPAGAKPVAPPVETGVAKPTTRAPDQPTPPQIAPTPSPAEGEPPPKVETESKPVPPPQTEPRESVPATPGPPMEASAPPAVESAAPAQPVEPSFPPVMKPEEREVWQALDRAFTLLAKPDLEGALRSTQGAKAAGAQNLAALLEKAKKLHAQALENLRKSPPQENVRLTWNKKELVGRVMRIDGTRAWVKMQDLELPVDVAALPHDLLVAAAGLEGSGPNVLADRASLLLALGDTEPALAILKRLKKEEAGGWAEALEQRALLERLSRFEKGIAEVEARIKDIQPREALAQLETLKRDFRDLAQGEQKGRLEYLAVRADSIRAIKRLKRAFSGEVVRADEDLSVEVRYDLTKGQEALKDFGGGGLKAEADGLRVKGNGWDVKFSTTGGVRYLPRFQTTKLQVEYLVSCSRHDIMLGSIGHAHVKIRWIDTGQILIAYEPQFTGNVFAGAAWKHPNGNGTYRYVFERTPDSTRFLLDDKEHFKQAAPKAGTEEQSWTTRLESNGDFTVKEFVVKGQVDPEWLKEKVEKE